MCIKFVLSIAAVICIVSCHTIDRNNSSGTSEAVNAADTTFVYRARTVSVSQTGSLMLYKPVFNGGLDLLCEYDCHPTEGDERVFVAAGAYTKSYNWSKLDHDLIAGPHIDDKFYEGYDEPANSGAFYYLHTEKRWDFVHDDYRQCLRDISETGACVAFSQVMLLSDREICSIHPRAKPNKLRHRRALCDINHELYIVDSKYKVSMFEFARLLKTIGVIDGLYMDMGSMRYSAYREFDGLEWVEIHPRNRFTKYCSNYLVFYR